MCILAAFGLLTYHLGEAGCSIWFKDCYIIIRIVNFPSTVFPQPGLYERRCDWGVVGDHSSRCWVCTDQVWHVLVDDAHRRHLPQIVCPRHKPLAGQDVIQELVLSIVPP